MTKGDTAIWIAWVVLTTTAAIFEFEHALLAIIIFQLLTIKDYVRSAQ